MLIPLLAGVPRPGTASAFPAVAGFSFSQVDTRDFRYDFAAIPATYVLNIEFSWDGVTYYDFTWIVDTDPPGPFDQTNYDPADPGAGFVDFVVGDTYYMRVRYQDAQPGSETAWGPWTVHSFVATFSPAFLAQTTAWWKLTDAYAYSDAGTTPVTDTGLIHTLKPVGGLGVNLVQATGANRPQWLADNGNGKPYAAGVDANTVLQAAAFTGLNSGTFGIYAAMRPQRQVANDRWFGWTSGNATNSLAGAGFNSVATFSRQGDSYGANVSPAVSNGTDYVIAWEMSGQTLASGAIAGTVSKDSGGLTAAGVGYGESGAFALWGGGAAGQDGPVWIYEVVVTNAPLTGTDRTKLIAYLADAY